MNKEAIKKRVEDLFKLIISDLNHEDWALNWTTDEYCWHPYKRIDLNIESNEVEMALIHEIAHIDIRPDETSNWHTVEFYNYMEELSQKYLGRGIEEHDWYRRDLAEHRAKRLGAINE